MSQAKETMLVAPDATLYIVPDEAALQRVARAREPPLGSAIVANLRQLLQWTPKPAGRTKHRDESDNWQLLSSVVWAGQGPYSVRIAMVGKRGNKLELFNRQAGTSYPHDDTFNKMLQGPPRHLDGWQLVEPPEAVQHLKDGSSLAGHWACLVNPPATQPAEVCFATVYTVTRPVLCTAPNACARVLTAADAHVRDCAFEPGRPHPATC